MRPLAVLCLLLALAACAGPRPPGPSTEPTPRALVLVSIDGFRWDYLDRPDVAAPTLRQWAAEGVRAERLLPAFPTKTFPNHYTLVTGLYPDEHGIVANTMFDPAFAAAGEDSTFSLGDRDAVVDARWWGGEPIWATARRQGVWSGTVFWPGSEAAIGGVRPDRWLVYDGDLPYAARIDTALAWLDRPPARRLVTLYFEAVDDAGHAHGPSAPETAAAVARVDSALARLADGLRQRGLADHTDVVVVSDHGMMPTAPDRVVVLDDVLDASRHRVVWGEPVGVWPAAGEADAVAEALGRLPRVRVIRKGEAPARLHYGAHRRTPPILLLADEGWTVTSRERAARMADRGPGGDHGHDNAYESLHGLFVARGPSFRQGARVPPVQAVDVYAVLAAVLGVEPAPHSGDASVVGRLLRPRGPVSR